MEEQVEVDFFPTRVDCNVAFEELLLRATLTDNIMLVDRRINPHTFRRRVVGIWEVRLGIVKLQPGETYEKAAVRVRAMGLVEKNVRSLLAFMEQYPHIFSNYFNIAAVARSSRGRFQRSLPTVVVAGKIDREDGRRTLFFSDFSKVTRSPDYGVLVSEARIQSHSLENSLSGLRLL